MFEISIKTHFSAAHHLEGYPGSCAAIHGHNWGVETFVRGSTLDGTGILVDFRKLRASVKGVLNEIDHTDLNRFTGFADRNPTSENVAMFLFERLSATLNCKEYRVARVTVSETPDSHASCWADEDSLRERVLPHD